MSKELELWQFIASRLKSSECVMLLVVAESSGSSPGRAGYKMAVAGDGELVGSIGGGVMEVRLVEQAKAILSDLTAPAGGLIHIKEQVHQKNKSNSSGMICSGRQTVIVRKIMPNDARVVRSVIECLTIRDSKIFQISNLSFEIIENVDENPSIHFTKSSEGEFNYRESLGPKQTLYIVGGGHCALALCELMSKMDFYIRIFDDRPELNTLDKNRYADGIEIMDSYDNIADHIVSPSNAYVVVMTIGYAFDKIVIQKLLNKEFKYFGVLGSRAKMATLMRELKTEGFEEAKLNRIHTPIGIPIHSRTPEEIAVSIAAEIISVKNS